MTPQKTISLRSWIELFALAIIWGGSFLSTRVALDEIGPLTVVLHRTGWAAVILFMYVYVRRLEVSFSKDLVLGFIVMGLLNNVIPFTLMAWGQLHIESGLTSIFNAATAIFGVILAAIFFKDETLTFQRGLGVLIGFVGVATAIGIGALAQFDLKSLAQLAVLAGTISYAFAGVWARTRLTGVKPEVAAMGMLLASTVFMLPIVFVFEDAPTLKLQTSTWLSIAYFSVIATAGAYLLYYRVLAAAGSGNLMLVTLLIAPIAIILGNVFLEETLQPNAIFGFLVLALGLISIDGRVFKWFQKH